MSSAGSDVSRARTEDACVVYLFSCVCARWKKDDKQKKEKKLVRFQARALFKNIKAEKMKRREMKCTRNNGAHVCGDGLARKVVTGRVRLFMCAAFSDRARRVRLHDCFAFMHDYGYSIYVNNNEDNNNNGNDNHNE